MPSPKRLTTPRSRSRAEFIQPFCFSAGFLVVMRRYIENIDMSFRYRYIESYRFGLLRLFGISSRPIFVFQGRFYTSRQ